MPGFWDGALSILLSATEFTGVELTAKSGPESDWPPNQNAPAPNDKMATSKSGITGNVRIAMSSVLCFVGSEITKADATETEHDMALPSLAP